MIALRAEDYGKLERIVNVCEKAGVHTKMIPDFGNVISTRPYIEDMQGIPVIHVRRVPLNIMRNRVAKRAVDLIGTTVAIILFFTGHAAYCAGGCLYRGRKCDLPAGKSWTA